MNPIDTPKIVAAVTNGIVKILKEPTFFTVVIVISFFLLVFYVTPVLIMTFSWEHQANRIVDAIKENCNNRLAGRSKVVVPTE